MEVLEMTIVGAADAWATAREAAVQAFGRGGATRDELEAAWDRLGSAERELLRAVQALRDGR